MRPKGRQVLGLVALLLSPIGGRLSAARPVLQSEVAEDAPAAEALDEIEALAESAKPWLEAFERWLGTGGEPPALGTGEFRGDWWVALGPHVQGRTEGARWSRARGGEPEVQDAATFAAALLGESSDRGEGAVHTKVVATRVDPEGLGIGGGGIGAFELDVRVEIEDAASPPLWQVVGALTIGLLSSEEDAASVTHVELKSVERVEVDSPLLVEKTAAIFQAQPEVAELLGVGMDRWAQRLDDPGLTAWFGHQGLAVGDANGDGRDDLYVAMPSGLPNLLLVQQPDGTVLDRAEELGVGWLDDTKGVLFIDVNGDGRDDIVSALGHVIVVQYQDGQGMFQIGGWCVAPDETPFYGISATDFDGDGDLDLFGARYVTSQYGKSVPVPFHEARNGPSNHFFRNTERGFQDVTLPIGLTSADGERFSLAGHFLDFDRDGDDDLYVVNDFGSNQLFEFDGGKFSDVTATFGAADPGAGMGAAWSDYDADGDLDLYVSNMFSSAGRRVAFQAAFAEERPESERVGIQRLSLGNTLLRRDGDGFTDVADASNTRMGRWAWGATFVDLNGDGRDDLVSPAGFLTGPEPGDL
ncbi:FG-GAP repeat protein [Planctomycetes bacterium Poly30]|uniref:FG-GAP repeat protein n=1 Tax=Saltatorellus ferox TaxID=2528018 RepID=A0A518ERF4_9BACT|nr:FG-GAP repeat protein [Planctomycetes bacterium Poly30]